MRYRWFISLFNYRVEWIVKISVVKYCIEYLGSCIVWSNLSFYHRHSDHCRQPLFLSNSKFQNFIVVIYGSVLLFLLLLFACLFYSPIVWGKSNSCFLCFLYINIKERFGNSNFKPAILKLLLSIYGWELLDIFPLVSLLLCVTLYNTPTMSWNSIIFRILSVVPAKINK